MTRVQRLSLGLALAVGTVGLLLVASTALAAPIPPGALPITAPDDVSLAPDLPGLDSRNILDPVEFDAVSDFTQRVAPLVTRGPDGVPTVSGVSAASLGVDEAFLADFERALAFAYQAVEDGHIALNDDFSVERLDDAPPASDVAGAGGALLLPGAPGAGELGDVPQWDTWNYPQGSMFFNSYPDYWQYYYNNYYLLCSAMAARLGYPWLSTNLVYFYTYNGSYFYSHCYSNFGTYFYLPYGGACASYNPCYGYGMSYRPVYFWVRSYVYNYGCGCYQQNWNWQGYWARY